MDEQIKQCAVSECASQTEPDSLTCSKHGYMKLVRAVATSLGMVYFGEDGVWADTEDPASPRVRELLTAIAVRGGTGHWTWPMIDELMGDGFCRAAADAEYRRIMDELDGDA